MRIFLCFVKFQCLKVEVRLKGQFSSLLKTIQNKIVPAVIATHFLAHSLQTAYFLIKSFLGLYINCKVTLDDELYPFLGIASKNILKKSCLQECAKRWVAITARTLLCCIYFSSFLDITHIALKWKKFFKKSSKF